MHAIWTPTRPRFLLKHRSSHVFEFFLPPKHFTWKLVPTVVVSFWGIFHDYTFRSVYMSLSTHMRGQVMISVLSLDGRYRILSRVSEASEGQNMNDIVTRAIKLILPSLECDNLFITYLCLYQNYSGAKIKLYFLIIKNLISFHFRMNAKAL